MISIKVLVQIISKEVINYLMAKNCNMALQEVIHGFERSKLINSFNKYDKCKQ